MPRPKTYDRASGLDQAMRAFWVAGYPATSMRDVLAKTGIGSKSLYAEFGGKDKLFVAAIEAYIQDSAVAHSRTLGGTPRGLGRIEEHLKAQQEDDDIAGCLLVNTLAESASVPAAALERIDAFFADVHRLYADNLVAARDKGEIKIGVLPEALAAALLIFDQGLAIAMKSRAQREQIGVAAAALLTSIRV